jgi:hypothetical protein
LAAPFPVGVGQMLENAMDWAATREDLSQAPEADMVSLGY